VVFFGALVASFLGTAIASTNKRGDDDEGLLLEAVAGIGLVIVASLALRKRMKDLAGLPRVILIRDVQMLGFGLLIAPMAGMYLGVPEQARSFLPAIIAIVFLFLLAHIFAGLVSGNAPIVGGLAVVSAFGALYLGASSLFGDDSVGSMGSSGSGDLFKAGLKVSAVGMLANSVCAGLLGACVFVKQGELRMKFANYSFFALAGYTLMSSLGGALGVIGGWPEKRQSYKLVFGLPGLWSVLFFAFATKLTIEFIQKTVSPELALSGGVSDVTPMPHVEAMHGMPAMPEPQFMVSIAGQRVGPFPVSHLASFVSIGQITVETMVWTQGMAEWLAAGKVPALSALFQGVAPPLPPA